MEPHSRKSEGLHVEWKVGAPLAVALSTEHVHSRGMCLPMVDAGRLGQSDARKEILEEGPGI